MGTGTKAGSPTYFAAVGKRERACLQVVMQDRRPGRCRAGSSKPARMFSASPTVVPPLLEGAMP